KNKFTMVVFLFGGIICSLALFESGVNFFNSISNGFTLSFFAALFAHLFSKNHFSVHPAR
ncbi:hypothetical protein, partial [Pantoea agglomerans]|uniref:hypothetical protein n=1 Tax=Enterobacter agglomerans TaxID=549 RepID=UPI003C7B5AB1